MGVPCNYCIAAGSDQSIGLEGSHSPLQEHSSHPAEAPASPNISQTHTRQAPCSRQISGDEERSPLGRSVLRSRPRLLGPVRVIPEESALRRERELWPRSPGSEK